MINSFTNGMLVYLFEFWLGVFPLLLSLWIFKRWIFDD